MKTRIKIDTSILFILIIFTGILFQFPRLYPKNVFLDDTLNFIGLWLVLTGIFFRMSARAHKKARSDKGHGLVTTGPYALVRNPMYLGTFLIGAGFILVVWPWFLLPVFTFLFFSRFKIQIRTEEQHLQEIFGPSYATYVRDVPGIFPRWKNFKTIRFKDVFLLEEIWSTKERNGLLFFPFLVVALEFIQDQAVFGITNPIKILLIFIFSMVTFVAGIWFLSSFRKL